MKLLESHNITLDGRPGIELTGESDQVTVTARFYIKGNRVYQVAALVFKGMDEKENVSKFFGTIMNSWKSMGASEWAPPFMMFMSGTGRTLAFGPPRYL